MKVGITILAALVLIVFNRVSAAEESGQRLVIKIADQAGTNRPPWPDRRRYDLAHRRSSGGYPVACEAVIFPRSPLCAGRPATFGPYGGFHLPWNYWYY
jgi:hypothetical protein